MRALQLPGEDRQAVEGIVLHHPVNEADAEQAGRLDVAGTERLDAGQLKFIEFVRADRIGGEGERRSEQALTAEAHPEGRSGGFIEANARAVARVEFAGQARSLPRGFALRGVVGRVAA